MGRAHLVIWGITLMISVLLVMVLDDEEQVGKSVATVSWGSLSVCLSLSFKHWSLRVRILSISAKTILFHASTPNVPTYEFFYGRHTPWICKLSPVWKVREENDHLFESIQVKQNNIKNQSTSLGMRLHLLKGTNKMCTVNSNDIGLSFKNQYSHEHDVIFREHCTSCNRINKKFQTRLGSRPSGLRFRNAFIHWSINTFKKSTPFPSLQESDNNSTFFAGLLSDLIKSPNVLRTLGKSEHQ